MGDLMQEPEVIALVERLVDLLGLRSEWNIGAFDGCVYEHMLPVFDSTYRHMVKPFSRRGEQAERARLERAIAEVFGVNSRGFTLAPPHQAMMDLVREYATGHGTLEYPIEEWTKQELFSEYDHSYLWSNVWGVIAISVATADVSALVAAIVGKILAAATVVRAAGAIGIAATVAGAAAAILTYRHYTGQRDKIREEIQKRIDVGDIDETEWDNWDLEVRRRYNA